MTRKLRTYHICYIFNKKKYSVNIEAFTFDNALVNFKLKHKYTIIAQIGDRSDFSKYKMA